MTDLLEPTAARSDAPLTTLKQEQLYALAQKRKATRWPGYGCIGDYHAGAYECDFVSPYSITAGNVDADIFVMLQDWSSDESLREALDEVSARYGLTPSWPTNRRLMELLSSHFGILLSDTYGTNLFPFIKMGAISSSIPMGDMVRAAKEFAIPQIRIVKPRLVICLGLTTFKAIQVAYGLPPAQSVGLAIASPFTVDGTRIWCQAHTGSLGQNNRKRAQVAVDWNSMKLDYVANSKHSLSTEQ
jgi:restriction system protein